MKTNAKIRAQMESRARRKNIFLTILVFSLLLILSLLSDPWRASAAATDDTGAVILGPPAPGQVTAVSNKFGIENSNPLAGGDPVVLIGGYVLVIDKTDQPSSNDSGFDSIEDIDSNGREAGTIKQTAVFAFGVNHSYVSFGGSLNEYSNELLEKWNESGVDVEDIVISCLNGESEITSSNIDDESVTITPIISADGVTIDYQFNISALIRQDGHCAVFMTSSGSQPRTVNNRDNDREALDSSGV